MVEVQTGLVSGPKNKPAAEVAITRDLVHALLVDQHPDLAHLPLAELAAGWDNIVYRLGDELLVRLPRRALAVPLVVREQRWLPELAPRLPLPVPVPLRIGTPSSRFGWPWSIVPYFAGDPALTRAPDDLMKAADVLGGFVAALHQPAPGNAPAGSLRGIPLAARTDQNLAWIHQLAAWIDGSSVAACWADHLLVAPWSGPPTWLHGDLHVNNLIVDRGELRAVIDFGDLTAGDPATDLIAGWMLFDAIERRRFRDALGVDDDTWRRGRAWALTLGLAYLSHAADDPAFARCGLATIDAVLADARRAA